DGAACATAATDIVVRRNSPSVNSAARNRLFEVGLCSCQLHLRPLCCTRATSSVVRGTQTEVVSSGVFEAQGGAACRRDDGRSRGRGRAWLVGDCRALARERCELVDRDTPDEERAHIDGGASRRRGEGGSPER